jgi:surfeit locus 1 family protein
LNDLALRVGALEFRPRLIPTLATLVLLPILLGLGVWQLDRAEQKRQLAAELASRSRQPAVSAADLGGGLELRYRKARVVGHYLPGRQVYLDNQVRGGQPGYLVFTPLRLPGRPELLLVNRGWLPAGPTRTVIPELGAPPGQVELDGVLDLAPRPGLRLGNTVVVADGWPLVVLELDPDELAERLGSTVLPLSLRIDGDPDGRLLSEPLSARSFNSQRHLGYALQWFGLAAALLVIFLVVNTHRGDTLHGGRDQN